MKTYELEFYGEKYNLIVKTSRYTNNDSLAVLLETEEGEPFATVTVNIMNGVASEEYQYIDTNNCSWAPKFIEDNGLGTPTGIMGFSGFCQYPLYRFNLEALK